MDGDKGRCLRALGVFEAPDETNETRLTHISDVGYMSFECFWVCCSEGLERDRRRFVLNLIGRIKYEKAILVYFYICISYVIRNTR